jgi:hypothetical protein
MVRPIALQMAAPSCPAVLRCTGFTCPAGLLSLPYTLQVGYAMLLNVAIWHLV